MYFKSRVEAGKILASQILQKYQNMPCAVLALSDGGVMVGSQVAIALHAPLMLLLSDTISLPRETVPVGGISQEGSFSYNSEMSKYELEDLISEYHGLIEEEKREKLQNMHRLVGRGGLIRRDLLENRTVILVSDGLNEGVTLDVAIEFLKPIKIERLIVATPLASVQAVDRMHVLADEIFCLSVIEDYISTDHYYDTPDVPVHEKIINAIEEIVERWKS